VPTIEQQAGIEQEQQNMLMEQLQLRLVVEQVVSQIATGAPKGTLLAPPATSRQLPEPNFAWASPYEAINKT